MTWPARLSLLFQSKPSDNIQGALAQKPQVIPDLPIKQPELAVTQDRFIELTQLVIDGLEGGYYHPDMKKNFSLKDQRIFGDSGETMYGLDRKHGAALAKYPEWGDFWKLVDKGRAASPGAWRYNAKNVPGAEALKKLAGAIMYKWFSYLAGKYILISSMDEIAADDRLVIHFSYASWNGEGWFKRYAAALNKAIAAHPGDKEAIFQQAIKTRTESSNAVIRQQGKNMMDMFRRLGLVQ